MDSEQDSQRPCPHKADIPVGGLHKHRDNSTGWNVSEENKGGSPQSQGDSQGRRVCMRALQDFLPRCPGFVVSLPQRIKRRTQNMQQAEDY